MGAQKNKIPRKGYFIFMLKGSNSEGGRGNALGSPWRRLFRTVGSESAASANALGSSEIPLWVHINIKTSIVEVFIFIHRRFLSLNISIDL